MLELEEKQVFWKAWGYEPTELQLQVHTARNRVRQVAGGERGGKSKVGAEELAPEVAAAEPGSEFWIVGPDYFQARAEFFYVLADLQAIDAVLDISVPKEGSCQLTTRAGTKVITRTGEDAVKLASFAPKGILMVEAAQQEEENFIKLMNRTAEARGWLLLTGTFESSLGWYAERYEEFQGPNSFDAVSMSLPTWSNLVVFPGGWDDPEIRRLRATNEPEYFMERFGGIPCPPRGVVFKEFRNKLHVKRIQFGQVEAPTFSEDVGWTLPEETLVQLAIDPGYAGAYAVLFVATDHKRAFVVDEVYAKGQVAEQVILETMHKGDLYQRVRAGQEKLGIGGVMDIAGKQHAGMASHDEIWRRMAGIVTMANVVPIVDGIHRYHTFLKDPMLEQPRIWWDPKCKSSIKEHQLYRYRDESPNRPMNENPIDKDNHSMKAISYWLVNQFGFVDPERALGRPKRGPKSQMETEVDSAYTSRNKTGIGWLS